MLSGNFESGSSFVARPEPFSYWTVGKRVAFDEAFDVFEASPSAVRHHRYEYLLTTPREMPGSVHYQVAIDKIGSRAAAASLSHPTLVPLIDAELDRPPFFWVEPRLRYPRLDRFFQFYEASVSTVLWIIRQIGQGVHHAHQQLRTLSQLAPSQILVTDSGQIMIAGLHDSVPFGHPVDNVSGNPVRNSSLFGSSTVAACPRHDLARIGKLIQWMIDQTHREDTIHDPAVARLKKLADDSIRAGLKTGPASADLARRLVDRLIGVEFDHVMNDSRFGH